MVITFLLKSISNIILLDDDCETGIAIARQWPANNRGMIKNAIFWDVAQRVDLV
jgi:hypothetical protein